MRKKFFISIVALVLSIILRATLITAQQSSEPPNERKTAQLPSQPRKQSNPAQNQTSADERGTEQSPIVVKVVPAQKTNEETSREQQYRQDQSSANWWMVKLTLAIGLIALVELYVFGLQARRLKQTILKMEDISNSQGEDMKASIEQAARSAGAMERVAADMTVSAQAAKDSVAVLKDRMAQQMRAYVSVDIGGAIFQDRTKNIKFQGTPVIQNSGHTPAYKLSYKIRGAILPKDLPEHFEFPALLRQTFGEFIIGPGKSIIMVHGGMVDDFVPDQDVPGVKARTGPRALYVWGVVTYEDIFGQSHKTEFCQSLFWLPNDQIFGLYTPGRNNAD